MNELLTAFTRSAAFGITTSIAAYWAGSRIQKRFKSPLANPLLLSSVFLILLFEATGVSYDDFNVGGGMITMLLGPATAALALSVYHQRRVLKENFVPVAAGCLAGSLTSIGSVWLLCRLFGLDEEITVSLLPKSVTMPIATGISEQHGGMVPVTSAAVVITGIFGAVFSPLLIRLFRVKNKVAAGVGIGASSHAAGTSRAIELGEVEGAMSGISIGVSGLITAVLALFF